MKLPKRQTSYLAKTILYAALAVLCVFDIKRLWAFLLIFIGITAFNLWMYLKHRKDLSFFEILQRNTLSNDEEKVKSYSDLSKKEKKKAFQDYLAKVEEDFSEDDFDYYDDDEYDDEDSDLYIK